MSKHGKYRETYCRRCLHIVEKLAKNRDVCPPCADDEDLEKQGFGVYAFNPYRDRIIE